MEIIVITNQKGGVGKSTTAEAFAEGLHLKQYKVLLIDLDPQGSISLSVNVNTYSKTVYNFMVEQVDAHEVIQQRTHGIDIIPASSDLAKIDMLFQESNRSYVLAKKMEPLKALYDYIIIDTPPALSLLTINAFTAADSVIVPAQADLYSLQGIGQLFDTIETIKQHTNPNLQAKGIVLTRHNKRSILSREMSEQTKETAEQLGTFLYDTKIRECIALREAQINQQSIYAYAPKSNAAEDYLQFTNEFIERSGLNGN